MTETTPHPNNNEDLNLRIARRISGLRAERGMSLEALASKCHVSRSMISLIERGESSPTAVVLDKLAFGLGVTLASLFEEPQDAASPLVRRAEQLLWTDPQSGYVRRNISPPHFRSPLQIVEVLFPAGATVSYQAGQRDSGIPQQIWLIEGSMEITSGGIHYSLHEGDCLAMQEHHEIIYQNSSALPARYLVVINSDFSHPTRR
ncbi:helix-turn-helix domain-containing protein [Undibacterium sp.]|uniref:helix-turn-helix domain-containing protein n=1 Tax=Undibacterium sp. TaxID=1914977 RepID=UPI0025FB879A|nr:helix-turn-helix domain-containing protein [Undibacterium sp.]